MRTRWKLLTAGAAGRVSGGLLILTILTSAALARRALGPADEREEVLTHAIAGIVVPSDVSSIVTPTAVAISEVLVVVGDELARGQPIARIDHTEALRDLAQLDLDLERARQDVLDRERDVAWIDQDLQRLAAEAADAAAQLVAAERDAQQVPMRQARDSTERAEIAYEQAVLRKHRLEQLAADGLVAQQDVDDARLAVRAAADDVANARRATETAKRVQAAEGEQARARRLLWLADQRGQLAERRAGLQQARLRLRQAQLKCDAARQTTADSFVRAPRAGAIIELPVRTGDRLAGGMLIAKIAALDPIAVDIDVEPRLAHTIVVGDPARVDVPTAGASVRQASVRAIAPIPGDSGKYAVRLTLGNPLGARLLAGQTAYVTLGAHGGPQHP